MISPIKQCHDLRATASSIITSILSNINNGDSESYVAHKVTSRLRETNELLTTGWYSPPPDGIGMLFGEPDDDYARLNFESLRKLPYWPSKDFVCTDETVGIVYVSPVTKDGIIADWGCSFYRGKNDKIKQHLVKCLSTLEQLAEFAEVGMKYSDISLFADGLFRKQGLTSNFIILINRQNSAGMNCGHSVPWTDKPPTQADKQVFASGDIEAINKLIANSRLFVSPEEQSLIPKTTAFTAELRLRSADDPTLPDIFMHLIVSFEDGKKTIVSNFNEFFEAMGMNYIHSKY